MHRRRGRKGGCKTSNAYGQDEPQGQILFSRYDRQIESLIRKSCMSIHDSVAMVYTINKGVLGLGVCRGCKVKFRLLQEAHFDLVGLIDPILENVIGMGLVFPTVYTEVGGGQGRLGFAFVDLIFLAVRGLVVDNTEQRSGRTLWRPPQVACV
jgi:hypothetical protein